jgi:16S rRNA (uracil1498-N3)-methyltransferase
MAALPKGNKFDDVVLYCTQLGVDTIAPMVSDRTLLNPSPQKLDRWRRIATEASEQSERQIVPMILDAVPFAAAISTLDTSFHRYLCVARGDAPHLLRCLQNTFPKPGGIAIAIGPEGGWTSVEVNLALAHGFKLVSLGRRIQTAVLAPACALSLVAAAFESDYHA